MRIAYFVNQYPKVSHSFIRREILALESQGYPVVRMALRGWDASLADPIDLSEREKTRYVLQRGLPGLLRAWLQVSLQNPLGMLASLRLAFTLSRRADRPLPYHLVYLAEACVVLRWMQQESITHVHAHFGTNSAEVVMLAHALGGPGFSFTVHGPEEFDKPEAIALASKIRHASFVVAISSFGRSQLYRWVAHEFWPKIHVVHCGLEAAFYNGPDIPLPEAPQLVCVGRLCEQKGQLLLLEAARALSNSGVDFRLVLAGDGEMRPEIEQRIAAYALQDKVRITGWISSDQVRAEILASRCMVLPSFAEGLPVVLMEAMALRRPVLSTYVAGIPELVEPGRTGWLIPAGDIDALTTALRAILSASTEELTAMGQAARQVAIQRHNIDTEAARLIRIIADHHP